MDSNSGIVHESNEVMIVDDTPQNLKILNEILQSKGYRVRSCSNGEFALSSAQYCKPSIVLLDIDMPVMDGFEVCRRFKNDDALSEIPILFLSAFTDTEKKIEGFKNGAVDYITKPFDAEEVLMRVHTHLQIQNYKKLLEEKNRLLEQNIKKLEKTEKMRDDFIHMLVHDMRTPLTSIDGYATLLQMESKDEINLENYNYIEYIRSAAENLERMVTAMVDVSRLEADSMPIKKGSVTCGVLVDKALETVGVSVKKRNVKMNIADRAFCLNCDKNITVRILVNFLGNAIKYTNPDETITIETRIEKNGVYFSISNTGKGIPPKYHKLIFEKFGQVKNNNTEDNIKVSSGLGLAYCKLAVEAQGGEIGVVSDVGEDTTFWFTLPIE